MNISNWFTEPDNKTLCPVRAVSIGTIGMYHVGAVYGLLTGAFHADMIALGQYAQHMMTLGGTLAMGVGAKSVLKGDAA